MITGAETEGVMEEIQTQKKEEQNHGEKVEEEEEEEGPPPGWESAVLPPPQPTSPPPTTTVSAAVNPTPTTAEIPGILIVCFRGLLSIKFSPFHVQFRETAQMVCGSCRRLLSYPKGTKHVKCSCCQTVNLVLEANQVGQVSCSNCKLLLMYPYGAPSVRCSSCNSVTDIRENNKRPPWSVQQGPLKTFSSVR
ncbi:protein LOL2 isoform X1 [Eutrema salsugineum]|uniref:protein LOL2 isoform X1 n=1 Tax=Eutrema salsugineum TaxID=72664 RepID=UPI000CECF1CC|nr:protein LOL2 isoform X1 [Eutrema salsugineum]